MSDKTPRQRFVEAQKGILAHVEAMWIPNEEFQKIVDAAADAFADQECGDVKPVVGEPGFVCNNGRYHEKCRATLRAEIRGDK